MAFCRNCGSELVDGAKFCQICGMPVANTDNVSQGQRQQGFEGKIYRCPNCGEILQSFVRNCPTCGFELRGRKATGAVREFALKLEAIESRREYESPEDHSRSVNTGRITKTDEQKISLIQSFTVPNTKEDMLEFMILATSNVIVSSYGSVSSTKTELALNDAWMAKIRQVYEKAKRSYGNEEDFQQIQSLYDDCSANVKRAKKKRMIKSAVSSVLLFGSMPALLIGLILTIIILGPSAEKKELARLKAIEQVVTEAIENGEYKKALLNAEGLVYKPKVLNGNADENERQWNIKRELLIDEIVEEAEKNGIHLEMPSVAETDSDEGNKSGGFVKGFAEGFKEAIQPSIDKAKKNIAEFNRIIEEGKK